MTPNAPPTLLPPSLLYRDACLLVINKPSGLAVHKGKGPAPHLGMFLEDFRFGLPRLPEITHRLDKDTSGCLILGRHPQALKRLGSLFQNHRITKVYNALVIGRPPLDEGVIDLPLGKKSSWKSQRHMKVDFETGQNALTHYKIIKSFDTISLLELIPKTGRTHQLRVHMQALGCPIVGDTVYGLKMYAEHTMRLHALNITVPYHEKKEPLFISAPLPLDFLDL